MMRLVNAARRRRNNILLVDDYDDARTTVREALEDAGYPVIEAANGQEALNVLVSGPPDQVSLIILDLQMPIMDGWRLMTLLNSYVSLASIPIIVATAQEERLDAMSHQPVFGRLRAPYELQTLVELVSSCLRAPDRSAARRA